MTIRHRAAGWLLATLYACASVLAIAPSAMADTVSIGAHSPDLVACANPTTGVPEACGGGSGGGSSAPFTQSGNANLAVTTSSARVALPSVDTAVWLINTGSSALNYKLGNGSVTAVTTDAPLAAGACTLVAPGASVDVAAIAASGSTNLNVQTGSGTPLSCGGGGGPSASLGQAAKSASAPVVLPTDPDPAAVTGSITVVDAGISSATAQNGAARLTGTPTASSFKEITLNGVSSVQVDVDGASTAGAFTGGAVQIEVSADATSYTAKGGKQDGYPGLAAASVTGPASILVDTAGKRRLRVRATSCSSCNFTVTLTPTSAPGATQVLNTVATTMTTLTASVTITRPANTSTYTGGYLYLADATPTAGGFAVPNMCLAGGKGGTITGITITDSVSAAVPPLIAIQLFNSSVTAGADRATFAPSTVDEVKLIPGGHQPQGQLNQGGFQLADPHGGVPGGNNVIYSQAGLNIGYTCNGGTSLYLLAEMVNAYVPPSNSEVFTFTFSYIN